MQDAGRARPVRSTRPALPAQPVLRIPNRLWWGMLFGSLGVGPAALFTLAQARAPLPSLALWAELTAAGVALIVVHAKVRSRLGVRLLFVTIPLFLIGHFFALVSSACIAGCS